MAAVWLLTGCGGGAAHNLVGTWDIKGGPGPATMAFAADGNFKTEASMPGRSSSLTGQYKLSGDTLTLQTMQARTATLKWNSADEFVMTGDDGKAMTLDRKK
jgi:uncharacterized protein (TIGR03066 family)